MHPEASHVKMAVLGLRCLLHRKVLVSLPGPGRTHSGWMVRTTTELSGHSLEAGSSCCLRHWPQGLVVELLPLNQGRDLAFPGILFCFRWTPTGRGHGDSFRV